jgi:hypothetical protein
MYSFISIFTLLTVSTIASPTPKSTNHAHLNHLVARQCGFANWDSSNLDNWADAKTDEVFDKWWHQYLGGNGQPNGWPDHFVSSLTPALV